MSDTKTRFPLEQVLPLAERLVERYGSVSERIEIAGSIRRRRPEVGDIEILAVPKIAHMKLEASPDLFTLESQVEPTTPINLLWTRLNGDCPKECRLKWGDKYRQFMLEGVKVDLFTCERDFWGWALLVRTGSAEFSHHVAGALNGRGYTSKDFKIHPGRPRGEVTGPAIATPEERDVFRLAHLDWIPPEGRSWAPRRKAGG